MNWLMLSDYYGRARFATLMGFMSLFMNVGMFISPYASGLVFDRTGSYYWVLAVFTPLYVVSAVAFLFATRPNPPVEHPQKMDRHGSRNTCTVARRRGQLAVRGCRLSLAVAKERATRRPYERATNHP